MLYKFSTELVLHGSCGRSQDKKKKFLVWEYAQPICFCLISWWSLPYFIVPNYYASNIQLLRVQLLYVFICITLKIEIYRKVNFLKVFTAFLLGKSNISGLFYGDRLSAVKTLKSRKLESTLFRLIDLLMLILKYFLILDWIRLELELRKTAININFASERFRISFSMKLFTPKTKINFVWITSKNF